MIFADINLARNIDGAEARLSASLAEIALRHEPLSRPFAESIAGGVAVYAGPGSPANKIIGAGFDEDLDPAALDRIERAFFERGSAVQAEVATLARPAVHALLTGRAYVLQGFEDVLARTLTDDDAQAGGPQGIVVQRVSGDDINRFMEVVITGFEHPDESGAGSGVALPPRGTMREHKAQPCF